MRAFQECRYLGRSLRDVVSAAAWVLAEVALYVLFAALAGVDLGAGAGRHSLHSRLCRPLEIAL